MATFLWQAMFPWPTLALGTHFRFRGNGLLGYSQTLTDHHFVMAARFCETLKSRTRTVQKILPSGFHSFFILNDFVPAVSASAFLPSAPHHTEMQHFSVR